eukprot:jgi/Tetstr1/438399/TSEL_026965.t1
MHELKELLAEDGGAVGNEEWEPEHRLRRDLGGRKDELEDDDDDYFFETESTVRGKFDNVRRHKTRTKGAKRNYWVKVAYPYKETTRRPHKPLSHQWLPAITYGKHVVHPDMCTTASGLLDQLFCNKDCCTFRVHPQQTPGSQLGYDVADLLERTTPDAAEWDGNKTELAGCGFTVTDDEATGEPMVVAYFTCNTPVEYRASVPNPPRAPVTLSSAWPTAQLTSESGVAGSLLDEVQAEYDRVIDEVLDLAWPRCEATGLHYPIRATTKHVVVAPPWAEEVCYYEFNMRCRFTKCNAIFTKRAVMTAFRKKITNKRGYLARAYPNESRGAKLIRGKKPSEDIMKRARALARAWHEGILGQHYRNGTTPPLNALCTEVGNVCEVTPVAESVPPPSRGVVRVSGVSSRPPKSRVALPLADATNRPSHAIVELQAALTKAASKSLRHNASAVTAAAKAADAAAANEANMALV